MMGQAGLSAGVAMANVKEQDTPLLNILANDAESATEQMLSVYLRLDNEVSRLLGPMPEEAEKSSGQSIASSLPIERIGRSTSNQFQLISKMHDLLNRLSRL